MTSLAVDEAELSDCVRSPVARADADRLLDREDKDLAVTDSTGARRVFDCFDRALGEVVLDHNLDFNFGKEVDDISAPR